ncbi:UDP-glycosyltransferase 83A1-like [Mangifera indica]|uniref:UDP-glycosyltransferase 83A1-like n=1 Tax=Mangifera indica TaxID=29780 RepID=UPI001CFC07F6|nr:UDP-glycosyltransferase 83A1-like [Mangifera indica]
MCSPHVVALPYPAQGHVIPLLELSQCLVKHGFRVTFVNTEFNHKRVLNALAEKHAIGDQIHLVSIPDGLELDENRNDLGKLSEAMLRVMPGKLEKLIADINLVKDDKVTCLIADGSAAWAIELAEKMKIKRVAFWPPAAGLVALSLRIPKLIDDGIIDKDGTPVKKQMIQLAPGMPSFNSANFVWACIGGSSTREFIFNLMVENNEYLKKAEYMICNSTFDLEPVAFTLVPQLLPIGPLLASSCLGNSAGYFWPEDSTCLKWLGRQAPQSVIYVAFGSFTVFDQTQFQELALGLEITNRPFLWVVRPDITDDANKAYPKGFKERVTARGQMIGWAPQQKVLSHPSIACFLSHCGWNSTVESVSNGVPILCWPYFADQFLNESYICDVWKVGLKFNKNNNGIITREEIKNKVDKVLGEENYKERVLKLKEIALNSVREGGQSNKNFKNFLEWVQE